MNVISNFIWSKLYGIQDFKFKFVLPLISFSDVYKIGNLLGSHSGKIN